MIVIVDNNSDLDNIKRLQTLESKQGNVSVIFSEKNLGYFRGLNAGINYLKNKFDFELCIIGNNDLIFPIDFISNLIRNKSLFEKFPVISPNIITMDGIHQNPHVIREISKIRELFYDLFYTNYVLAKIIKVAARLTKFLTDRSDEKEHEISRPIYQGYGACYILTQVFFYHFNELWAPTFLMGEEFFLSKQLESRHYQFYYEPSIVVKHFCHATVNKMPGKSLWRMGKESHKLYRQYVKLNK